MRNRNYKIQTWLNVDRSNPKYLGTYRYEIKRKYRDPLGWVIIDQSTGFKTEEQARAKAEIELETILEQGGPRG